MSTDVATRRLVVRTDRPPAHALVASISELTGSPPTVTETALVSAPAGDGAPAQLWLLEAPITGAAPSEPALAALDGLDAAIVRTGVALAASPDDRPAVMRAHFMHRAAHLDRDGFTARYDLHAPLVLRFGPMFAAYVTNSPVAGAVPWDGMSQQWFTDHDTAVEHTRVTLEEKPAVAADITEFIGFVHSYETAAPAWVPR